VTEPFSRDHLFGSLKFSTVRRILFPHLSNMILLSLFRILTVIFMAVSTSHKSLVNVNDAALSHDWHGVNTSIPLYILEISGTLTPFTTDTVITFIFAVTNATHLSPWAEPAESFQMIHRYTIIDILDADAAFASPWAHITRTSPLEHPIMILSPRAYIPHTSPLESSVTIFKPWAESVTNIHTHQNFVIHLSGGEKCDGSCFFLWLERGNRGAEEFMSIFITILKTLFTRVVSFTHVISYFWEYTYRSLPYVILNSAMVYVDSMHNRRRVCYIVALRLQRNTIGKHEYANRMRALCPYPTYVDAITYAHDVFGIHTLSVVAVAPFVSYGMQYCHLSWSTISLWYGLKISPSGDLEDKSASSNTPFPIVSGILMCLYDSWHSISHWYGCECQSCDASSERSFSVILNFLLYFYDSYHSMSHWYGCECQSSCKDNRGLNSSNRVGGGKWDFKYSDLVGYASSLAHTNTLGVNAPYRFVAYVCKQDGEKKVNTNPLLLLCRIPLYILVNHLTLGQARDVARSHHVFIASRGSLSNVQNLLAEHVCTDKCLQHWTLFSPSTKTGAERQQKWYKGLSKPKRKERNKTIRKICTSRRRSATYQIRRGTVNQKHYKKSKSLTFPPRPPKDKLLHKIINGFCKDTRPSRFVEAGCAVCGHLRRLTDLLLLSAAQCDFEVLRNVGVACLERKSETDPLVDIDGPILDPDCDHVCSSCHTHLKKGLAPPMSLANGLWLGKVPTELSCLTFVEKLLISRVRHNRCIVRVASGRYKMRANAVSFQNPIPKIYNVLPPPIKELDEVLAFIYTGPCQPTKKDLERTPLLVRRTHVGRALRWLKLNHSDYQKMEISEDNLEEYPECDVPVVIDYRQSTVNKDKEATSVHDNDDEDGAESGNCPFVVHGLTGEEFSTMRLDAIKAHALEHLMTDGKVLLIGHSKEPQSIYNNPQLFPSMLPWLFPYGLGGIGNTQHQGNLSSIAHKRHLLMYHDKRFQTDPNFPLIAFNHEQIKDSTTGGFLTAEKTFFPEITNRLLNVDLNVLAEINRRLSLKERVQPETEAEKTCYKLITDLDIVGGHVKGSATSKKYMRNEIWSLMSFIGAPSWFITLSPADNKHPICLYFADSDQEFKPEIKLPDEAYRLVAQNPVAAARFFHFMCDTFIKHVLGVDQKHPGLFGKTSAYYGTVEQQGRLTLHMHLLLWIKQSLSPQDVRDRIMDCTSEFQKYMVEYLEAVHMGQFFEGGLADVKTRVKEAQEKVPDYVDPTKTMADPPPPRCRKNACAGCFRCTCLNIWWDKFRNTVDDLVSRSNVHSCRSSSKDKEGKDVKKGCLNSDGQCKARFPRKVTAETMVDPLSGALEVKKGEPWLNTFTPTVTYLLRCNTDVTSLLSGTAIKAVVGYITDYVTKPGLNTYSVFDTIRQVFNRNSDMIGGTSERKQTARSLMIKIVNALTAKMEIGSPMASLYLLGNPDHYTGHKFIHFYWKNYVREARSTWETSIASENPESEKPETVVLSKNMGEYVGLSSVQDYIHRPRIYQHINLYEWIQMSRKSKRNKTEMKVFDDEQERRAKAVSLVSEVVSDGEDELDLLANPSDAGGGFDMSASDDESMTDDSDYIEEEEDRLEDDADVELNIGDTNEYFEDDRSKYEFLPEHPQYKTHQIHCDEGGLNMVPNFIGGTLPRCDQGDREYYCSTMLTLFKPWRNGHSLKIEDQTWDESFMGHQFSLRQVELMKNFNLRYECNDARDDYSAKRKKDSDKGGFFASWATNDMLENLDESTQAYDDDGPIDTTLDESAYLSCGHSPESDKKIRQMNEIERIVKNAGWLDESPDGVDSIDTTEFRPTVVANGSKWHSIVQTAKQAILRDRIKNLPSEIERKGNDDIDSNEVKIGDISYLRKNFQAEQVEQQNMIDETVTEFHLNTEQERAFRIVANHATTRRSRQLKMYLGGMGGTGKSQVLKALTAFFNKRKESHRIMILAPTGTAAALLNGSTYHSALGIPIDNAEDMRNNFTVLAQVRARLDGVDYIFLDEISMVACHSLYKISAQLAKARNIVDVPFGGVNMIFAGDFAQLPPVGGTPLYSSLVGTLVDASQTTRGQQSAIGKALWHQVTTVVILRQNMRQTTQTEDDAKLRTTLENMRYAACTVDDIRFLRTRIAGRRPEQPKLAERRFRNVSIITAWNSHKDRLNRLGCERFAAETNQKLTHFYSIDTLGKYEDPAIQKKRGRRKKGVSVENHKIGSQLQDVLWNLQHSATNQIPGKLSICIGMPVMIKNNDATELCITKGQEGYVVGWQSTIGPSGQLVLDTLFVKLCNPARTIKIDGLPDDVVPLTKSSKTVECICPSDLKLYITRSQVNVLPNFSMTDYGSQGKTRPFNVVDLNNCKDHMSYYTCLSRSATCEGTVLIQGFDDRKITKGASGHLRQEFREHELLDEISKHMYNGTLPPHINGYLRNTLIRQYQLYKGTQHVPSNTPYPLKWTKEDPMNMLPVVTDSPWMIVSETKKQTTNNLTAKVNNKKYATHTFVPAIGSVALSPPIIHTRNDKRNDKKRKIDAVDDAVDDVGDDSTMSNSKNTSMPVGFVWDELNYSCAYDALFTILYDIWIYKPLKWSKSFESISPHMRTLSDGYKDVTRGKSSLVIVRDNIRNYLYEADNMAFPRGKVGTSVIDLATKMLCDGDAAGIETITCIKCNNHIVTDRSPMFVMYIKDKIHKSISEWFKYWHDEPSGSCVKCKSPQQLARHYNKTPRLLIFSLDATDINISKTIKVKDASGKLTTLCLRGIVYLGGFHFTSRIVSPNKDVWYHDGMETKQKCIKDGNLSDYTGKRLLSCRNRKASAVIYAKK
jgi:hypothetical protein